MSYRVYTTQAIILRIIPHGESNARVVLFTRDLGKITAHVQAFRKSTSKMRMFLTRFQEVTIDLIQGSHTWRVIGVTEAFRPSFHTFGKLRTPLFRMLQLAEVLIQGQHPHPELYSFFQEAFTYADERRNADDFSAHEERGFELHNTMTLLDHLGYWPEPLQKTLLDPETLTQVASQRSHLVKKINESIYATQIMIH